jgi:Ca-activated chloride channel family protein
LYRPLPLFACMLAYCLFTNAASATEEAQPFEWGPQTTASEMGAGGLLLKRQDGLRAAPTLSTDVGIQVTGLISRTRVAQKFHNPTSDWVEGVYVFPLPEGAAVDSLKMKIGERVIEGQIQERAKARATYKKAKREGKKASLVEQERPNIFTSSVANLGPGEDVEVIFTYQEEARYDAGSFSLRFPMVVGPRYIPGTSTIAGFSGTGWSGNTDEVPDAERITPPVADPADDGTQTVSIRVEIDAGFRLEEVESASHPVRVRAMRSNVYEVEPKTGSVRADSDFVLSWRPVVGEAPGAALFSEERLGEKFALLMVLPPSPETSEHAKLSKETIFVIDTSGSMAGESIVQARLALIHALDRLRPEDAFNVIRFDSSFVQLHPESVPATADAVEKARQWVAQLAANGGTEMLPALEAALEAGSERRAVRQVIFMTDGAVGNESALFQSISKNLDRNRLYTVGIGSAPNSHFMSKAAKFGRGTFTYIASPDEVSEKMGALFSKLDSPVLHDLAIDWGVDGVETWPARLPDVYLGEPVVVAARIAQPIGPVVLMGRRGPDEVRIELDLGGGAKQTGVARLWARRKIASLMDTLHEGGDVDRVSVEVARLGIDHHLVTRWTSLVAVDVTPTAPVDVVPETRAVPTLLPRGWSLWKLFGGADTEAIARNRGILSAPPKPPAPSAISQPMALVASGRLPQGATPAGLFVSIGSVLLGMSGLLWRVARRA